MIERYRRTRKTQVIDERKIAGSRQEPQGFTLIELLIVVAIIAILAAIAVPNFMEAQVRAKVSRVKADMRTLATGIEAYAADYNKYPRTYHLGADLSALQVQTRAPQLGAGLESFDFIDICGQVLTTPVAYLTSIPYPSPFQERNGMYGEHGYYYERRVGEPDPMYPDWYGFSKLWSNQHVRWWLMDGGPDRNWWMNPTANPPYEVLYPYDPTNGTVSWGNIWWLGGGKN